MDCKFISVSDVTNERRVRMDKEQADKEYLKKFLEDIETLKAEKEKKYNENEVKYGKA